MSTKASAVIFLVHLNINDFKTIANTDNVIVVDTNQYPDTNANQQIVIDRYDEAYEIVKTKYNMDMARVYMAGWSAGGNFILLRGSDPQMQQNEIAGYMVFPGAGGNTVYNNCKNNTGRKAAFYYAVGDRDTGTGYTQGVPNEARALKGIAGYGDRVNHKVWAGATHDAIHFNSSVAQEAWNFVKPFNTLNH